jgi:hypothetical protein
MFCSKCGSQFQPGARFCGKCGEPNETSPILDAAPRPVSPQTEPFGFRAGTSKTDLIGLMGADSIEFDSDGILSLKKAPKPHPDFVQYTLYISPSVGLVKVVGTTSFISTNAFGEAVRSKFSQLSAALEHRYGKPKDIFDFERAGGLWTEPQEWMMSLLQGERSLVNCWNLEGIDIFIKADAVSTEQAVLRISYEFPNLLEIWTQERARIEEESL